MRSILRVLLAPATSADPSPVVGYGFIWGGQDREQGLIGLSEREKAGREWQRQTHAQGQPQLLKLLHHGPVEPVCMPRLYAVSKGHWLEFFFLLLLRRRAPLGGISC